MDAPAELYGAAASWHSEYDTVTYFPLVSRFSLAGEVRRQLGEPAWLEAYESGGALAPDHATWLAASSASLPGWRRTTRAVPSRRIKGPGSPVSS